MSKKRHRSRKPKAGRAKRKRKAPEALIDIVMLVFGEWAMLEQAIKAVEAACLGIDEGYRIIVVDNGTPDWRNQEGKMLSPHDQAISVKEMLRPQDAFYRLEENQGYPAGINFGVSKGVSPLILIWTADVTMTTGSILEMVKVMDDPQVGVVGPKLVFPSDSSPHGPPGKVQHAGIAFNIEGNPFHPLMGWAADHPKVNVGREVQAVTGAIFLTRRSLWQELDGFWTGYGRGTFEDMEYCFAARAKNFKIVYQPVAWGTHQVGGSISQGAEARGFALHINASLFRGRWGESLAWDEWRFW